MIKEVYLTKLYFTVCLVLALILNSGNTYSQSSSLEEALSANQKLAIDIFKELIEINTTSAYGSSAAAEAMAARLKVAGFPADDIMVIGPDEKHKNLVVRYHGTGKLKPILFISHLDVVEALASDWTVDPFTFLEKDGYYYGRGTTDIKSEDADLIANLIRLRKEGYLPDRDIIVALTADEEGGHANGVNWLLENHREAIDSDFAINPDGGGGEMKNGKNIQMGIQTSEKIYLSFKMEAKNKGGHSSLPIRDNAIYRLASALTRLADYNFPVELNETTRNFFEKGALKETGQVRADMLAILQPDPDEAAANRLASESAYYNAMMRTTCVATLLEGGHAENALPQSASAIINCRMLPDDTPAKVLATLKNIVGDSVISVTLEYASFVAPLSPFRDDVMKPVDSITASMWPGVSVMPVMSTGATDGKFLRRSGIPVYGVSGMFGEIDDVRAHGKDERIGKKEYYEGVEFMYRLIKALSSTEKK